MTDSPRPTPSPTPDDALAAAILAMLERREASLRQLAGEGARRRLLADAADGVGVLSMLDARQAQIDALLREDQPLARALGAWDARTPSTQPAGAGGAEIARRRVACDLLLEQVRKADEEDLGLLTRARDSLAGELGEVSRSRRALAAYAPDAAPAPRYQDGEA